MALTCQFTASLPPDRFVFVYSSIGCRPKTRFQEIQTDSRDESRASHFLRFAPGKIDQNDRPRPSESRLRNLEYGLSLMIHWKVRPAAKSQLKTCHALGILPYNLVVDSQNSPLGRSRLMPRLTPQEKQDRQSAFSRPTSRLPDKYRFFFGIFDDQGARSSWSGTAKNERSCGNSRVAVPGHRGRSMSRRHGDG